MQIRWRALSGALGLALLVTACGNNAEAENAAKIEAGREIYETGGAAELPCSTCHSLNGTELVGPSFEGIGQRAETRVDGMSAEEYLRQSITAPSQYVVPDYSDAMPKTYAQTLSQEEIDNVVHFLLTQ